MALIELKNINKTYNNGQPLHVLKGIDLHIEKGEFVSIMGASGSGKSTLLNILGILDNYDTGTYTLNGTLIKDLTEKQAADYRNHMIVVNAYLRSGRIDEASAYLAAISSRVDGTTNKIMTGNFVADAILNHKAVAAAEDEIVLTFDGAIPGEGIANEDLCTILANLLDNAIEACRALPPEGSRAIKVYGARQHDNFLLHVENPTTLEAVPAKTTKRDRKNHGLGLKNVERAAKQYSGSVNCSVENHVFSADVRLCLKAEN